MEGNDRNKYKLTPCVQVEGELPTYVLQPRDRVVPVVQVTHLQ